MSKVINFDPTKRSLEKEITSNEPNYEEIARLAHIEEMVDVLKDVEQRIRNGEITEFIVTSMTPEGVTVNVHTGDYAGAIGMLEMGKYIILRNGE